MDETPKPYITLSAEGPDVKFEFKDEAPRPPSLLIAMPCYGGIESGFVDSLLRLQLHLLRLGIAHEFRFLPGESLITRARNRMVRDFLDETTHTHLLFLDCDLVFSPTTVVRLLTSGFDVVGGAYAKKGINQGVVGNPAYRDPKPIEGDAERVKVKIPPVKEGFVLADEIGTGCMLISRRAFESMKAKMTPYRCDLTGHSTYPFFDCGPEDSKNPESRYLSEDFWMARLWQTLCGGEVWLDTRATIRHVGKFAYDAPSLAQQWEGK